MTVTVIIIMGVAGSGKTTIGQSLAQKLGWPFYDGDDYHPAVNVAKMAQGKPLDDADRLLWLDRLRAVIDGHLLRQEPAVLACSALKRAYRDRLGQGEEGIVFVYLRGNEELIRHRMKTRQGHYFKEDLLRSQLEILEEPGEDEAIIVDISHDVDSLVAEISNNLNPTL